MFIALTAQFRMEELCRAQMDGIEDTYFTFYSSAIWKLSKRKPTVKSKEPWRSFKGEHYFFTYATLVLLAHEFSLLDFFHFCGDRKIPSYQQKKKLKLSSESYYLSSSSSSLSL